MKMNKKFKMISLIDKDIYDFEISPLGFYWVLTKSGLKFRIENDYIEKNYITIHEQRKRKIEKLLKEE